VDKVKKKKKNKNESRTGQGREVLRGVKWLE
jgi:hypothetical protein